MPRRNRHGPRVITPPPLMKIGPAAEDAPKGLHPLEYEQIEVAIDAARRDHHVRVGGALEDFLTTDSEAREREQIVESRRPAQLERNTKATQTRLQWEAQQSGGAVSWWRRVLPARARVVAIPAVMITEAAATYLLLAGFTSNVVTRVAIALIVGAVLALMGDQLGAELADWWRDYRQHRMGYRNHRRPFRMAALLTGAVVLVGLGTGALRASGALGSQSAADLADAGLDATAAAAPGTGLLESLGEWGVYLLLGVVPALAAVAVAMATVNELADRHDELVEEERAAQAALADSDNAIETARRARQRAASALLADAQAWPSLRDAKASDAKAVLFTMRAAETEYFGVEVPEEVLMAIEKALHPIQELEFPEVWIAYARSVFNGDLDVTPPSAQGSLFAVPTQGP